MCSLHEGSTSVNREKRQLFDVVGFDSLGQPQMTVGEGLPLQAAISRSLGFNANPGRLIAAVVPTGTAQPEENVFDRVVREKVEAEAPGSPTDASSEPADSEVSEHSASVGESQQRGDEDAEDCKPVSGTYVNLRLIRYNCHLTGERLWWPCAVKKREARSLCKELARRGREPRIIKLRLGEYELGAFTDIPAAVRGEGIGFYLESRKNFVRSMLARHLGKVLHNLDLIEDTGDIGIVAQSLRCVAYALEDNRDGDHSRYDMGECGDWRNDELEEALDIAPLQEKLANGGDA